MRAGIRLAIFGPPNVGKSSLLNFLGTVLPSGSHADVTIGADTKKKSSSARGCDRHPRAGHDARHLGALA
jgi:GTPase SAR1 family protein